MALHCCFPFSARSQFRGLKGSRIVICADILSAMLLRATGQKLQVAYRLNLRRLGVLNSSQDRGILPCGNIAALVYLWNPLTILSCLGLSNSPIENLAVIVSLYGAVTRRVPLAEFGLIMATHLSLYPETLANQYSHSHFHCRFFPCISSSRGISF